MTNPTTPGPREGKAKISPFKWLAIVAAMQLFATGYCIHRVDRATKQAAKEKYDSIQKALDDTLQLNAHKIPDSLFEEVDRPDGSVQRKVKRRDAACQ